MPSINWHFMGRSQMNEFNSGNSRTADGFVQASCPWLSGYPATKALFEAWNPIFTSNRVQQSEGGDPFSWDNSTAECLARYVSGSDTFTEGNYLTTLKSAATTAGAASASDSGYWWFPVFCLWTSGMGPVPSDSRDLIRRAHEYVASEARSAFLAAGGNSARFKYWMFSASRGSELSITENRNQSGVMDALGGDFPYGGITPISYMVQPGARGGAGADGIHHFQSDNMRLGIGAAMRASQLVGGPSYGGLATPRIGRPWRINTTTIAVPVFHPNGALVLPDLVNLTALRWATTQWNVSSGNDFTIASIDTSLAASGKTILTCNGAGTVPDACFIHHAASAGTTRRPLLIDLTPESDPVYDDWTTNFLDIYSLVPPSLVRVANSHGVLLESADPSEAWDGTRTDHPLAGTGVRGVVLDQAISLGNGSIQADVTVTGGVTRVLAQLYRNGALVQTRSAAITSTGSIVFSGLENGSGYRVHVRDQFTDQIAGVVVS